MACEHCQRMEARMESIEQLLQQLLDALATVEDHEDDDDEPPHDLDGNPVPLRRNGHDPL